MQALHNDCARKPEFISAGNVLVTNIFRIFLLNANQPLTPVEMQKQMPWTGADTILRTLTAGQVYMGLRPATDADRPAESRGDRRQAWMPTSREAQPEFSRRPLSA